MDEKTLRGSLKMSPHPIPPKRSFAYLDEPGLSLRPRTLKRLRIETEEAEQEAKVNQYRLIPVND